MGCMCLEVKPRLQQNRLASKSSEEHEIEGETAADVKHLHVALIEAQSKPGEAKSFQEE